MKYSQVIPSDSQNREDDCLSKKGEVGEEKGRQQSSTWIRKINTVIDFVLFRQVGVRGKKFSGM